MYVFVIAGSWSPLDGVLLKTSHFYFLNLVFMRILQTWHVNYWSLEMLVGCFCTFPVVLLSHARREDEEKSIRFTQYIHVVSLLSVQTHSLHLVCKQKASTSDVKHTSPMQTLGKSGLFHGQMYFSLHLGSNSKHNFSPLPQLPELQTSFFT